MACDLKQTIKDKIVGNATSYIIKENEIVIPITSKCTLSQTYKMAEDKINKINQDYFGDIFGNPVSMNKYTDGTGINIHISNTLQEASDIRDGKISYEDYRNKVSESVSQIGIANQQREYLRNIEKEANERGLTVDEYLEEQSIQSFKIYEENRELEERRNRYNSRLTPVDEPAGENFEKVVIWKTSQLAQTNYDLERAKMSLSSGESKEKRDRIKQLEDRKVMLEEQITFLNEKNKDLSLQTIFEDLDNIKKAIKSDNLHDIDEVRLALDFYDDYVKEVISEDLRDSLASKIGEIKTSYLTELKNKVRGLLEDESLIQQTLDNLNSNEDARKQMGKQKDEPITLEDLLVANQDIGIIDSGIFGLISSSVGDTIIPQYLIYAYKKALNKWENFVYEQHIDKLREFANKEGNNKVNREDLLEKDSHGVLTGNLVNLTSTKWQEALKEKNQVISNFIEAKYSRKKANYIKAINWYKKNSDAVNFFKLKAVRDIYGSNLEYQSYFIYDDAEMDNYESELRETLGPLYDSTIKNLMNKLDKYDRFLLDESHSKSFETRKARQNIWEFLRKYVNTDLSPIGKTEDGYDVYFSYFNDFIIIPKKEKTSSKKNELGEFETINESSGYYSDSFDAIRHDDKKLELWNIYKDMSEFINATYDIENFGKIKAPMIEEQFTERLLNGFAGGRKNTLGRLGKGLRESAHMIKEFYYEKGANTETKRGISKNMADTSDKLLKEIRKAKMLSGLPYEQADREARQELYSTYSTDLDSAFEVSLKNAATHQARMELDPISEMFKDYLNEYQKDRKRSKQRVDFWVTKVIKNKSFASRGKAGVGAFEPVRWLDETSSSKNKYWLRNVLRNLSGRKSLNENIDIIIPKKILKLLSDQEKIIIDTYRQFADGEIKDFNISDFVNGTNYYFEKETLIDEKGEEQVFYYMDKPEMDTVRYTYSESDFKRNLNEYLYHKVNEIGLSLNISGMADGILTTNLIAGMGLKPVSGLYQRMEGKSTNLIMDAEGWYWTPGNLPSASEFLAWTNTTKVATRILKGDRSFLKRKEQVVIFQQLIERMSVLQQRTDELQKDAEGAGKLLDVFAMAITLPEFKNQGEIALAMMADFEVTDDNGDSHKLFDIDNMDFPAFMLENGVLKLKPDFSNIDVTGDDFQNLVIKIGNAIKEIQGNYDKADTFLVKSKWYGRGFTQYFTWLPEFYNRRFGTTETGQELNVNIAQGKRKVKGRYLRGASASKTSTFAFTAGMAGVAYGSIGAVAAIPLSAFLLYKVFSSIGSKKSIKNDVNSIIKFANFMEAVAIESVNFPAKIGTAIPLLNKLKIRNKTFSKDSLSEKTLNKIFGETDYNNLTKEERGALRAMALEMAFMLNGLLLKFIVAAMLFDDEDDEMSDRRLFYNFAQNQLSKYINTYNVLGTAPDLIDGALENGIVKTNKNLYSLMKNLSSGEYEKAQRDVLNVLPVPSDIKNMGTKQLYPWQNKTNFDENAFVNPMGTMSWVSKRIKNESSGGEKSANKEWSDLRKKDREKIKKEFKDISGNKEVLKIISNNILEEKYVNKRQLQKNLKRDVSYKELLEIQEEEGANPFTSRNTLRKKLIKKLVENTNLTDSEIDEVIERRFSNY